MADRGTVLSALLVLLVSTSVTGARAQAQQREPVRIGVLTEGWGPKPATIGLRDGLQALGYREGEQFDLGVRFTQGDLAALLPAARELVAADESRHEFRPAAADLPEEMGAFDGRDRTITQDEAEGGLLLALILKIDSTQEVSPAPLCRRRRAPVFVERQHLLLPPGRWRTN